MLSHHELSACTWPTIGAKHLSALQSCIGAMFERYDVVGALASGTIIRGTPDRRSDLDVHILHEAPFRQRLQKFFGGVPCEIFVNPPSQIPRYFEEDQADRKPMTAHMFSTGFIVYDPQGLVGEFVAKAEESLAHPMPAPESPNFAGRYGAATTFEDLEDLSERDLEAAKVLLGHSVWTLVQCRLDMEPGVRPRIKDAFERLKAIDPEAAALSLSASEGNFQNRLAATRRLCLRVTGESGFFEWESGRQVIGA